ncbi:MAG: NAD(+)/NADH kinase [Bacillota bacterium]
MAPVRIGIMANLQKKGVRDLIKKTCSWLSGKGINVVVNSEMPPELANGTICRSLEEMVGLINCLLVFGGDGTILNSARMVASSGVPILGINLGHLGFLSEIDIPEINEGLDEIIRGEYEIEERMMIETAVIRDGMVMDKALGLNDAVITKGAFARLITLRVTVNGEYVGTYPADGIIVATPTGSTAYSLSAGGPVVTPDLDLMLITPICPHTLWTRPMVISSGCIVEVEPLSQRGEIMLTIDGQHGLTLVRGDIVKITGSPLKVKFIRLKKRSFFDVLKQKLREEERPW